MSLRVLAAALAAALLAGGCVSTGLAPGHTPQSAAALNLQLAVQYMNMGELKVASEKMDRALAEDPRNPTVQASAGLLYERLGEPKRAEEFFARAMHYGKNDPDIENMYAGYLCRKGDAAQGEKMFVEVAHNALYRTPEIAYTNAGVCVRGTPTGGVMAEQYFRKALIIKPNAPEPLLQLGELSLERGDLQEAHEMVQKYLGANLPSAEIYWLGVRVERKLGDIPAAAVFAHRLESEFPNSSQAQMLRSGLSR